MKIKNYLRVFQHLDIFAYFIALINELLANVNLFLLLFKHRGTFTTLFVLYIHSFKQ